jgi:hypothetical protein
VQGYESAPHTDQDPSCGLSETILYAPPPPADQGGGGAAAATGDAGADTLGWCFGVPAAWVALDLGAAGESLVMAPGNTVHGTPVPAIRGHGGVGIVIVSKVDETVSAGGAWEAERAAAAVRAAAAAAVKAAAAAAAAGAQAQQQQCRKEAMKAASGEEEPGTGSQAEEGCSEANPGSAGPRLPLGWATEHAPAPPAKRPRAAADPPSPPGAALGGAAPAGGAPEAAAPDASDLAAAAAAVAAGQAAPELNPYDRAFWEASAPAVKLVGRGSRIGAWYLWEPPSDSSGGSGGEAAAAEGAAGAAAAQALGQRRPSQGRPREESGGAEGASCSSASPGRRAQGGGDGNIPTQPLEPQRSDGGVSSGGSAADSSHSGGGAARHSASGGGGAQRHGGGRAARWGPRFFTGTVLGVSRVPYIDDDGAPYVRASVAWDRHAGDGGGWDPSWVALYEGKYGADGVDGAPGWRFVSFETKACMRKRLPLSGREERASRRPHMNPPGPMSTPAWPAMKKH